MIELVALMSSSAALTIGQFMNARYLYTQRMDMRLLVAFLLVGGIASAALVSIGSLIKSVALVSLAVLIVMYVGVVFVFWKVDIRPRKALVVFTAVCFVFMHVLGGIGFGYA